MLIKANFGFDGEVWSSKVSVSSWGEQDFAAEDVQFDGHHLIFHFPGTAYGSGSFTADLAQSEIIGCIRLGANLIRFTFIEARSLKKIFRITLRFPQVRSHMRAIT